MARLIILIAGLILFPGLLFAREPYHTNPLCWNNGRNYHPKDEIKYILDITGERLSIGHAEEIFVGETVKSPNKAYAFSHKTIETEIAGKKYKAFRRDIEILIYSERPYLIKHYARNVHGLSNIIWVNEKTIYYRLWWGRIVGVDVFYDVEEENVIALQPVTAGWQQYNQFMGQCASPQWKETEMCNPECISPPE